MQISSNQTQKTMKIFTDKYNAYSGRHNFLCNLGYSRTGRRTMTITFENTGVYTFDRLRVVCQPMNGIGEKTEKIGEETLQNAKTDTNQLTGTIEVSAQKALVFALPYSEGFTAYVDGKKAELKKANTMYMAVELSPGKHQILLSYCTPYLKTGMLLTGIGCICYLFLVFYERTKGKNKRVSGKRFTKKNRSK